ncbi:hypothetical protein M0R04_05970 [Candidatus Dojkabacteria bacterium]|jgi:hypothetical protein|nr:hypothetical protein [Candidatus Dojkabacteria bacterium]
MEKKHNVTIDFEVVTEGMVTFYPDEDEDADTGTTTTDTETIVFENVPMAVADVHSQLVEGSSNKSSKLFTFRFPEGYSTCLFSIPYSRLVHITVANYVYEELHDVITKIENKEPIE